MNCFKMMFLSIVCCTLFAGCQGTGILVLLTEEPKTTNLNSQSESLCGHWTGTYEKTKIELDVKQSKNKEEPLDVKMFAYNKDKKQPLIPLNIIIFQEKENKYAACYADVDELVKQGDYYFISNFLLYPVMKLYKIAELENKQLSVQEVIFTQKSEKDNKEIFTKLDPSMKTIGDTNMLYGTPNEILGYLRTGKYQLSPATILKKTD